MSMVWNEAEPIAMPRPTALQWLRLGLRAFAAGLVTLVLVITLLLFQLLEKVLPRVRSHRVVRLWARIMLWIAGVRLEVHGAPMPHGGAVVTNHGSWLDILAMHSAGDIHFVSKSEVASWPVLGWLARTARTAFIERRRSKAHTHQSVLRARLDAGDRLCFFPEGTSTDTLRILPFKSTLFAPFITEDLRDQMWIQPATMIYHPPPGRDPAFYGWWGEMEIGPHLAAVLALGGRGRVEVHFHEPVRAIDYGDRKLLAREVETVVRDCFDRRHPRPGPARQE